MFRRIISPTKVQSYILIGPRGTGKTTFLKEIYQNEPSTLWIDLLTEKDEDIFARHPDQLSQTIDTGKYQTVIIDEIQKAPKLLDIVHREIEKNKIRFILTGSSARKLRRGGANMLAGRAISYGLHPLTSEELGSSFNLGFALEHGTLPVCFALRDKNEISLYLKTYVRTYLKEEIIAEQIVRNVEPYRDFLEIAAQSNGQIINHSKISNDIGVDDKTVKSYFAILEDTLLGFHLKPFHRSVRKRQRTSSKFFFFDPGVKRALDGTLSVELKPKTYAYGKAFEHFMILEALRMNDYGNHDFRFSYLITKDDAEIDLIVERPGNSDLLLEIKSSDRVDTHDTRALQSFYDDWDKPCEAQVWSNETHEKKIGSVTCLHWREALKRLFCKQRR